MSTNDFNIIEELRLKGIILVGFKLNHFSLTAKV